MTLDTTQTAARFNTSRGVVTKYEVNSSHLLSPTTVPVNTMPLIVKHYILSIAISISFKAGLVQSNGLHRQLFPIPATPEPFVVCLRQQCSRITLAACRTQDDSAATVGERPIFHRSFLTYSRYARQNRQNLCSFSHRFAIDHLSPTGC